MILSKRIVYFLTLVESECYLTAAEKLCITVSALRHSMSELEKLVNQKLLFKNRGGIRLTEAGAEFYAKLLPVYKLAYSTFETCKQKDNYRGSIRIVIAGFYYPDILFKARSIMSKTLFKLNICQSQSEIIKSSAGSQCDLYIQSAVAPYADYQANMFQLFLSQEKIGLLVTRKMKRQYASLDELIRSEKILLRNSLQDHPFIDILRKNLSSMASSYEFLWLPDFMDIMNAIRGNIGFTFFPVSMIDYLPIDLDEYEFIHQPFKMDLVIERYICFDKKYYQQLISIATTLKNHREFLDREGCI